MNRHAQLDRLFRPGSIAVVGASSVAGKLGKAMFDACASGHDGSQQVFGINPKGGGGDIYPSLQALTDAQSEAVDLAVLCVPAGVTPGVLREAADSGVGAALICSGGFAETGRDGKALQDEIAAIAAASGIRVLGPNTSGFFRPSHTIASFVPTVKYINSGGVAVVAASGGMNHTLSLMLSEHGVGISLGVGLGNSVDVSYVNVLEYLQDDASTTAIALHVESVGDGQALLSSVRTVSRSKPIVAMVVGRSDVSSFSESHTGALATSWSVTRSLLTEAGAVVVDTEHEMVDALAVLSRTRLPASANPGVGLVTAQAGPGLMILDDLNTNNISVPVLAESTRTALSAFLPPMTFQMNPVDTGRPGGEFDSVLATTAADAGVDVLAIYALVEPGAVSLANAVRESNVHTLLPTIIGAGGPGALVKEVAVSANELTVPVLPSPTSLAIGVRALVRDARIRYQQTSAEHRSAVEYAVEFPADEAMAKDLLDALDVPTPPRRICADRAQAHQALHDLGLPVAIKILDANVLHKTDIGGVHLDIRTAEQLDKAFDALVEIGASSYLVESMADVGVDLFVGVRRDPEFGPIIVAGLGGIAAEAIGDVVIRSCHVTHEGAVAMLGELKSAPLLNGWRGGGSSEL